MRSDALQLSRHKWLWFLLFGPINQSINQMLSFLLSRLLSFSLSFHQSTIAYVIARYRVTIRWMYVYVTTANRKLTITCQRKRKQRKRMSEWEIRVVAINLWCRWWERWLDRHFLFVTIRLSPKEAKNGVLLKQGHYDYWHCSAFCSVLNETPALFWKY